MRNLVHLVAALVFFLVSSVLIADDAKVLVVGSKPDHPFGTHMYEFDSKLLVTCLNKNAGVSASYVPSWPPTEEQIASAKAFVFYSSPTGSVLLTDQHRERFTKLMQGDIGFVAIHWGTGVGYDKVSETQAHRDLFKNWLGGWFRRPPCDITTTRTDLFVMNEGHPIARGWLPWKIHDEFYLNPVLHEKTKSLLEVEVNDKRHVVGWTFERAGQGRSVGISLGHFHHNFARDDFRRMLVNAILWSANVEVPEAGAITEVKTRELQLPSPRR